MRVLKRLPLLEGRGVGERVPSQPRVPLWQSLAAVVSLVVPHLVAVLLANELACAVDPWVSASIDPLRGLSKSWSPPLQSLALGRFGLLTTVPLLLAWTLPTVVLHTLMQSVFRESGLLGYAAALAHPIVAPLGLTGADLVRVTMGFGCNVPAVASARGCARCSRDTCIAAIGFGAACSYQLAATLSVFAEADVVALVPVYIVYLTVTMFLYIRLVSSREQRRDVTKLREPPGSLFAPSLSVVFSQVREAFGQFCLQALPVFFLFSTAAVALDDLGVLEATARRLEPLFEFTSLPGEVSLVMVLAAVRKDGILLLGPLHLSSGQLLVATFLASTLTPCLVTLSMIARTRSLAFVLRIAAQQAAASFGFTVLLAALLRAARLS